LIPPHRHTREDEISCVISGEVGFRSDGREVSLGAGGYIVKPRGELHSMWNAGSEPARMIEIVTPAGFEKYFIELAQATAAAGGRPDPSVTAPSQSASGSYSISLRCPTSLLATGLDRRGRFPQLRL
jgi:gentisate 1,2-dioxygenase